ncbi:hypothetical protein HYPSUDRAFT_393056 [Hypholoma sublateritium FD-334 SS-4]|uniref:Uncharacterized protein n=1 Tax=Hypholoma sublateritium (strain FD-334 SS-4) TaxID=945553 RepID=A0A0D2LWR7_HYPSF|nr:hypothetical protein HYPSUDRAFT_393056 [Hypholoma sublateritium FD-334 SS-4]
MEDVSLAFSESPGLTRADLRLTFLGHGIILMQSIPTFIIVRSVVPKRLSAKFKSSLISSGIAYGSMRVQSWTIAGSLSMFLLFEYSTVAR